MSGLKEHNYEFVQSGSKVSPDEIDQYTQYVIQNPSVSNSFFGTVESASAAAFVLGQTRADYPRNVLLTINGVAGGMGGTATVNGVDFQGNTITETLGFATAAAGGTVAGTKIFARVTSATVTPVGLGGTAVGSAKLGVAIGTSATLAHLFGFPDLIGGTTDLKSMNWINNGTINVYGTPSTRVTLASNAFSGTATVAITDSYNVTYKTTKDLANRGNQTNL
jgi:hypothetical protein